MSSFRRRLMMAQTDTSVPGVKESEAGDICVYNVNSRSLAIIKAAEWSASTYPINTYVPIGIVVVPASHGHYEGGKCAIMSLNYMSYDTPTTGGNGRPMYFGIDGEDIVSLPNLNKVPYVGSNGNVSANVLGETDFANLPSDDSSFTALANPYDNKTKYYYNDESYYAPSPYNNDGSFNTEYSRITSPSSTANCLADFDGYGNTKKILELRGVKDYSTWKPTYDNGSDYPSASCCDMYFTQGTKQGDWYLPSAGELGYITVRQKTISDSINKLITNGLSNIPIRIDFANRSSSECSDESTIIIWHKFGEVKQASKRMTPYGEQSIAFCLV